MAPPPYVTYQLSFRPGDDDNINAEWDAKTPFEKKRWKTAYDKVRSRQRKFAGAQNPRIPADRVPDNLINEAHARSETYEQHEAFDKRVRAAVALYDIVTAEYDLLADEWQALHDLEKEQSMPNNESLQHAMEELRATEQPKGECDEAKEPLFDLLERPPMAEDPEGHQRLPEHWLPEERPLGRRVLNMNIEVGKAAHDPGYSNDADAWRPAFTTGGGFSTGVMWVGFDEEGLVMDRVFRKDTLLRDGSWYDAKVWEGDVRSHNNKQPLELVITDAMEDIQGLNYTVRMRVKPDYQNHLDNDTQSYKMYLEYADKGDISQMIKDYKSRGQRIPGAMVWYVAEALAFAGKAMRSSLEYNPCLRANNIDLGHDDHLYANEFPEVGAIPADVKESLEGVDAWKEIVHQDLKPGNVFLEECGPADQHPYPGFARPLLGDYGIAIKTDENDIFNPRGYNDRKGTPGFLAPEQTRRIDVNTAQYVDE